jgi:hypothetical protein
MIRFFENGIINSAGVFESFAFVEDTFNTIVEDEEVTMKNLDLLKRLIGF